MSTHVQFCPQIMLIRRRAQRAFPKGRVTCNKWVLQKQARGHPCVHMLMQLMRGHECSCGIHNGSMRCMCIIQDSNRFDTRLKLFDLCVRLIALKLRDYRH